MPRSSQTPLTPVPVPISTTARALPAAASSRSAAPAPGVTASTPTSRARLRAVRSTRSSVTYDSANCRAWAVELPELATVAMGHLRAAGVVRGRVGGMSLEAAARRAQPRVGRLTITGGNR